MTDSGQTTNSVGPQTESHGFEPPSGRTTNQLTSPRWPLSPAENDVLCGFINKEVKRPKIKIS